MSDTPQWIKDRAAEIDDQASRTVPEWGTAKAHAELEQRVHRYWFRLRCLVYVAIVALCAAGWFGEWRLLWIVVLVSFLIGYRWQSGLIMTELVRVHRRRLR